MQGDVTVTHDDLAKEVDAMVKVLLLIGDGVWVVVVVRVVGLADFVDAVKGVEHVESREVATGCIVQRN